MGHREHHEDRVGHGDSFEVRGLHAVREDSALCKGRHDRAIGDWSDFAICFQSRILGFDHRMAVLVQALRAEDRHESFEENGVAQRVTQRDVHLEFLAVELSLDGEPTFVPRAYDVQQQNVLVSTRKFHTYGHTIAKHKLEE